jgi:hypothetical protein
VAVDERRVVMLVAVVVRAMLELTTEHASGMMMGDVVMVVRVELRRMDVLLLCGTVAHRGLLLRGDRFGGHAMLLRCV